MSRSKLKKLEVNKGIFMKKGLQIIYLVVLTFSMLSLSGCGPTMVTKSAKFPLMYEENPLSILVLPPINRSTASDAKEYYSTTIQEPLSLSGFYTFPYEVTSEILKMEGIYDSELLYNMPLSKFQEYFGADAVMFTTINKWDMSYLVLAAGLTVEITCEIKSTKSDQTLWKYTGTVYADLSGGNTGGGIGGLVAKAIITAINSALADYVPYAKLANGIALSSIPTGPYHSLHAKDQESQIAEQPSKHSK
jgi:hypothetical protein